MPQDGIPRQWSNNAVAHRELWTVDPPQEGDDVLALQIACAERLRVRGISPDEVPIGAHGKFTWLTALACIEAQYFLGLRSDTYMRQDSEGHRCVTIGAQRVIRDPARYRTEEHLQRARDRHGQLDRGPRYYDKLAGLAADWRPRIVTPAEAGLRISRPNFGPLGPEGEVTTHYAASARARNLDEGIVLARSFDRYHRSKGWGSLSYWSLIPDTGELILGRSSWHKGAHVAGRNYGNIGINFFCTLGDYPTPEQGRTFLWLLANAHTDELPWTHRTDRDLRLADIRGHNQWPRQRTDCPGYFTPDRLERIGAR